MIEHDEIRVAIAPNHGGIAPIGGNSELLEKKRQKDHGYERAFHEAFQVWSHCQGNAERKLINNSYSDQD